MPPQNSNSTRPPGSLVRNETWQRAEPSAPTAPPLITIFALPKPFGRDTDLIQRNAIRSWTRLKPFVDVLLLGNEPGIAEAAAELGVRHSPEIVFNESGTPLVSSAFEIAQRQTHSPFLAYCNSDVILLKNFVRAVEMLAENEHFSQFVAFGPRIDLRIEEEIKFDKLHHVERLIDQCKSRGVRSSNVCKEYFIFNRELYSEMPPFAIGRGNWDNWMIHSAKQNDVPTVNVSDLVTAIHQSHDYTHTSAGRFQCYVSGAEARTNRRLAGGSHIISGSTAQWRLTGTGLKRTNPLLISRGFWADVPRFVRLLGSMLVR